jgi:protein ImuB
VLTEAAALADRLAALPTDQLPLPPPLLAQLAALGLGRVGACLALPRAAAARRLTPQFLDCLDRLLGHRPEPLPLFTPPARFRSVLEMPCEVDDAAALHFALHRQLIELALWLHGRGAAVQGFSVELRHAPPQAATRLRIGLAAPSRDGARMSALARERLQSLALPAPVRGLVLHAARVVPFAPSNLSLFPSPEEAAEELPALLDKLRARLGETAVYALACCPEHRPERAWRRTEPGQGSAAAAPWPQRPLWLVDPPRPLPQRDARPYWNGPLQLEHGPERIEAGWWDGGAVGRDYFAARSADHSRLWVFLEHHSGDWFLHGFFS